MQRWWQQVRRFVAPSAVGAGALPAVSLVSAQFWIDRTPWRVAAFWAAGAGLLAAGAPQRWSTLDGKTLVLLLLLADVLWGALWRMAGGRAALLTLPSAGGGQALWLPYLQDNSPATRLFREDEPDVWAYALRGGGPVLLLALLVSAALGRDALLLTCAAAGLAALGWTFRRTFGALPALLASLATVGLPWLLALRLLGGEWSTVQWLGQMALLTLWVVHQWGAGRVLENAQDLAGLALVALAQLGLCLLLIVAQAPLWLALLVLLFLPTWLAVARQQPLRRQRLLWLVALLVERAGPGPDVSRGFVEWNSGVMLQEDACRRRRGKQPRRQWLQTDYHRRLAARRGGRVVLAGRQRQHEGPGFH